MNRVRLKTVYQGIIRAFYAVLRVLGRGSVRFGPPVGFYSVLANRADVNLVIEGQESPPVAPGSLRERCGFRQHLTQPWPIFWVKISPARLVGRSLAVMNERKEMMAESIYGDFHGPLDPSYNYVGLPPEAKLAGPWTSMLSRWFPATSGSYYHWMMDALPRLALLDRFPVDTGILTVQSLTAFQRDTLEILGLVGRCRLTPETHLVVENYYHSSFTAMTGCDNPYALHFLRSHFLGAADPATPTPDKIYISRLGASRSPHGEEEMVAILDSEGWAIVRTEEHSFREQVALFSRARAVCAAHGAGLTNLIWCPPGCEVLELCPANFLNGCYEGIASCLDLRHRYLVFEADADYRMSVDLKQFRAALATLSTW